MIMRCISVVGGGGHPKRRWYTDTVHTGGCRAGDVGGCVNYEWTRVQPLIICKWSHVSRALPRSAPVPTAALRAQHPAASIHARTSATMAANAWSGAPARRYPSIVWACTIISRVYFGNKTRSKNNRRARERIPPPPAVPPLPPPPPSRSILVRASEREAWSTRSFFLLSLQPWREATSD